MGNTTKSLEILISAVYQGYLLFVSFRLCRTYAVPFSLAYRQVDVSTGGNYMTI